ncbi:MAG: PH domain-containing protein [Thermoanaerobaculia bacterium]
MSAASDPAERPRFPCTLGGSIAASRRRFKVLMLGMGFLMLAVAVVVFLDGRVVAALLALAVALVSRLAWRMSGDLTPVWLEVDAGSLTVRTRSRRVKIPLEGVSAKALTPDELAHLERLAAVGGFVVATGGFDSHLLGEFDLYASDLGHAVLVEAMDHRLVLTPDDPTRFREALAATA